MTPRKTRRTTRVAIKHGIKTRGTNNAKNPFAKFKPLSVKFATKNIVKKHKVIKYTSKTKAKIVRSKNPRITMGIKKISSGV